MDKYQGSKDGERPIGGGKNTSFMLGGEVDNFLPDAGRVYGYFAIGKGTSAIGLFRADGLSKSKEITKNHKRACHLRLHAADWEVK